MNSLEVRPLPNWEVDAINGLSRLPKVHKDPFDRIQIVQANLTGSTLVSPDKIFSQYPVNVRWGK